MAIVRRPPSPPPLNTSGTLRHWQLIRMSRHDLTDHVIHFTNFGFDEVAGDFFRPRDRLVKILRDGYIRPTFAAKGNRIDSTPRNTIKGPTPAVCLTEQPLWAVLAMQSCGVPQRYSGYGIAYHKCLVHQAGGRPVIYATQDILGTKIKPGEAGYEEAKEIFRDGLPMNLQWLWSRYEPEYPGSRIDPVDFTWEREWRYRPRQQYSERGMPIAFSHHYPNLYGGAIIVEKDEDIEVIRPELSLRSPADSSWRRYIHLIVSLETAKKKFEAGALEYGRIETWPDSQESG